MPTSRADVSTDAPDRYAKQLAAHLGRRLTTEEIGDRTRLVFDTGRCDLVSESGRLVLLAEAETDESLDHIEDVVGRHLERFGQRNELQVSWQR